MATISDLLSRLRTAIDDSVGGKTVFKENLKRSIWGNQVGAGNKSFRLNNQRIAVVSSVSTLLLSADGAAYAAAATEDDLRGIFTLASAPATSLFAQYDWTYFTDTELTDFLTQAGDFVGVSDVTTVPVGLIDAFIFKAGADAAMALAARKTGLYNAGAGGKTAQKGDISKKYRDLSTTLFDRAVAERTAYYGDRKGAGKSPAYGSFTTSQRPYTPRR